MHRSIVCTQLRDINPFLFLSYEFNTLISLVICIEQHHTHRPCFQCSTLPFWINKVTKMCKTPQSMMRCHFMQLNSTAPAKWALSIHCLLFTCAGIPKRGSKWQSLCAVDVDKTDTFGDKEGQRQSGSRLSKRSNRRALQATWVLFSFLE